MSTIKHNLDEDQTLSGSLEFTIDGKTYVVPKVSDRMLEELDKIDRLSDQFAYLAKVEKEEISDLDFRKVAKAMQIVLSSVYEPLGGTGPEKLPIKQPKETTVKNGRRSGKSPSAYR